jgi:DNA-directed RNA polymerase omega subunit
MLNPSIGKLIKNYQSRYQLVIDVAKYARYISELADEGKIELTAKPVDMALNHLAENYDD